MNDRAVTLTGYSREDFLRILTEPKHALTKQYEKLLGVEGVEAVPGADVELLFSGRGCRRGGRR